MALGTRTPTTITLIDIENGIYNNLRGDSEICIHTSCRTCEYVIVIRFRKRERETPRFVFELLSNIYATTEIQIFWPRRSEACAGERVEF